VPPAVVSQISRQLLTAAHDLGQESDRRAEAAYQYAVLNLGRLQIHSESSSVIDQCLNALALSATLGLVKSQSIVGHCFSSFGRSIAFDASKERQKWLLKATKFGSLTARRRLEKLDPALYEKALRSLRVRYAGIGMQLPKQFKAADEREFQGMLDYTLWAHKADDADRINILLTFISCGRVSQVKALLPESNVNCCNAWKETPLLFACRTGNAPITRMLLAAGADSTLVSEEDVSPLHFLAAFDDEDVGDIASRLVSHGALLEARTRSGTAYRKLPDSTFGSVNGTPLLWAVAANSTPATKALLSLGADPFDQAAKDAPVSDGWENLSHVSPVLHASTKHQYYLLELLLSSRSTRAMTRNDSNEADFKSLLNHNFRHMGNTGITDTCSPLGYCVTYLAEGLKARLLLHGEAHRYAFEKTFETLVRAGADPLDIDGKGTPALTMAVDSGQPFVVDFMMAWNNGKLRPAPWLWIECLIRAVAYSDAIMHKTLLQYSSAEHWDSLQQEKYFFNVAKLTDDVQFLEPFRCYRNPSEDLSDFVWHAFQEGNFSIARWLFCTGTCDVLAKYEECSLLGYLVKRSKTFDSSVNGLVAFLKFPDLPEETFLDCMEISDSSLSALQLAVIRMEYSSDLQPATSVVRLLADRWNQHEHFNNQIAAGQYKGMTALHLAIMCTNVEAVRYLLEEEGDLLDLTLRDDQDKTVMDTAFHLLRNQKSAMDNWDVPAEKQAQADEKHFADAIQILFMLHQHGAKNYKYSTVAVRYEPGKLGVWRDNADDDDDELAPWVVMEAEYLFKLSPTQLERLPYFFRKAAELRENDALLVINSAYAAEKGTRLIDTASAVDPESHASSRSGKLPEGTSEDWRLLRDKGENLSEKMASLRM
jgi:ankyrin repeat protein